MSGTDVPTGLAEVLRDRQWTGGVEVEIGCGNGHFLVEYAQRHPERLVAGIEIKAKRCRKAAEKIDKRGLSNAVIIRCGAERFVRELAPRSVDAFHIYFPDPWPKSRHRKRRFFAMENLQWIQRALAPGGRLWFATDFFDYYLQAKVLVLASGAFRVEDAPMPQEAFRSVYARKFAESPIYLFGAARVPSVQEPGGDVQHDRQVDRDGDPDGER